MTRVINLSQLAKEPDVVLDIDGVKHPMRPATVESFIENVKLIEALGTNASVVQEMEAMITIITRSFPSLTAEDVRGWPLEYLQSISDLARGQNGELVTTDEAKMNEALESGNA